ASEWFLCAKRSTRNGRNVHAPIQPVPAGHAPLLLTRFRHPAARTYTDLSPIPLPLRENVPRLRAESFVPIDHEKSRGNHPAPGQLGRAVQPETAPSP